jgi:tetratricopeptide (TPR) repeat protein
MEIWLELPFTWHLNKRWVWRLAEGQILTELGDYEKAVEIYQDLIDFLSNLGSQLEGGQALFQRGRMLNIKNQTDAADKVLE